MNEAFPCQLIIDPPADGAWNMALDEALLQFAAEEGIASLRFYQWQTPTLSLGYFQQYEDRQNHPPSLGAAVVRRQSGGGAILHDREITYSISLPKMHPLAKDAQSLYNTVHKTIATILEGHLPQGHRVSLFEQDLAAGNEEPFLCFQRRARGDLVYQLIEDDSPMAAKKILGSAQRRSRGAVLQHGSLLLERSLFSPELPGLNDLSGISLTRAALIEELRTKLLQALYLYDSLCEINPNVYPSAHRCYNRKYGNALWTKRHLTHGVL